ncbi:helix-turn-helix domain-containing protein [Streptomyces sp. NPDC001292]|uniref:helix-turn-helix domain-containing protein n=1 Tax=Streptomyces sp. NPDC001292 TaxID=3364558 RepID=UPI00367C3F7A
MRFLDAMTPNYPSGHGLHSRRGGARPGLAPPRYRRSSPGGRTRAGMSGFLRGHAAKSPVTSGELCIVLDHVRRGRAVSELLDAVDALLARPDTLPSPEVRARLRKADGLTQEEVAQVFGVTRVAFHRWETGVAKPRRRHLEAYVRLLNGWAAKHPEAAQPSEPARQAR